MNAPADLLLRLCVQAGEIVVSHEAAGSIETLLRNGFVEVEELTRGRMRVVPTQAG